jgi:hypothetical protein
MSLLNPGAGEITDRLTILSLKALYGAAAGKDVSHFVNERNGLLVKLRARELNGAWFECVLQLGAVNAALWARTDEQRRWMEQWRDRGPDSSGLSGGPGSGFITATAIPAAECGIAIMRLNDERARLVRQINVLSGDVPADAGEEKL